MPESFHEKTSRSDRQTLTSKPQTQDSTGQQGTRATRWMESLDWTSSLVSKDWSGDTFSGIGFGAWDLDLGLVFVGRGCGPMVRNGFVLWGIEFRV